MTIGIVKERDCSFSIIETQYNRASQMTEHERADLSTRERLHVCVCVCAGKGQSSMYLPVLLSLLLNH